MRRLSFIIIALLFSLGIFAQQSPHGEKLKIDCSECHSTGSWQVNVLTITFNHSSTEFLLDGQHSQIDCNACHVSLVFSEEKGKNSCTSCHLDVHQQVLGNDCELCHTSDTWIINDVSEIHFNSRFPLVGVHANADCFDCHISENLLQFRPMGIECMDCHRDDYVATTNPNHLQSGYTMDCLECHSMLTVDWKSSNFEHDFFPLTEGHALDDCIDCHSTGPYESQSPDCETCHMDDYNSAINPPHASSNFSINCLDCHSTNPGWSPATFEIHNEFYILEGAHALILNDCAECHSNGYINTPNTCYNCHTEDYNTTDPSHLESNFSTECTECHSQSAWTPSTFDHNTVYVLEDAHALIANDCAECHSDGYINTPNTCYACHTEDYNSTTDPSHIESNFSTDCTECHSQSAWTPSTFEHNTVYVLEDAHALIANDCAECHFDGYINTPNTCFGCHTEEYNGVTDPSHLESNFSTDCTDCHSQSAWTPSTFDHNTVYVLEAAHALIANDCVECHSDGYINTPNTCYTCHTEEFTSTTDPSHIESNFSTDCTDCHSQSAWTPSTFDHNTVYVLEGAHALIANDCAECHIGDYTNTSNTCYACHTDEYTSTTDPSHLESNFSTDCTECHSQSAWTPSTFDHNTVYVLEGAHALIANDCLECHSEGYVNTPNTCFNCHSEDYNSTTNPSHLESNFSTDCTYCHSQSAWTPSTFDHNSVYVLEGAHALIANDCAECHIGDYTNTPNTCYACHTDEYTSTTDPSHLESNFSTDCTDCHSQSAWTPSTFDHNTVYVLEGAHDLIANDCLECHSGGYVNTPNTCFDCHSEDYNSTTDPAHLSSNFPTDCTECHSQTAWEPSTFDHDGLYFPIYSGEHQGEWNSCTDCHTLTSNYALFSCIDCHEHNQTDMDDEHSDVNDYVFNSISCLSCHPNGESD
ncbi:MAG: hypothetical protein PF484_09760 [Bacteroidales bacterium]|jgi:hypothetical protein|nr:hypothetical protein [Bacteroidales bacterium]